MPYDNDQIGMLASALPPSHYEAYPPQSNYRLIEDRTERLSMETTTLSARMTGPPTDIPVSMVPPESRSLPAALLSPGPRRGDNDLSSHQDRVSWANSTRFLSPTSEAWKHDGETLTANNTHSNRPSRRYSHSIHHFRAPWKPGFWNRCPWRGFGALSLGVTLTAGSVVLLFATNNTVSRDWKAGNQDLQPQFYLSILDTMTSLLTCYAFAEGMAIRFWWRLLRGSTLANVNKEYESSFFWSALRHIFQFQFNTVAVSTLFTTISFSRGPFFQRALVLSNEHYYTNTTFIALGIITSMLGVLAILPLYNGYWDLGRQASLSPLEIARAFGAPLFDGLDGNITSSDIAAERGDVAVRYGACERFSGEKVLRVEDTSIVSVRIPRGTEILG